MKCNICGKRIRPEQPHRRDFVVRGFLHKKCMDILKGKPKPQ